MIKTPNIGIKKPLFMPKVFMAIPINNEERNIPAEPNTHRDELADNMPLFVQWLFKIEEQEMLIVEIPEPIMNNSIYDMNLLETASLSDNQENMQINTADIMIR